MPPTPAYAKATSGRRRLLQKRSEKVISYDVTLNFLSWQPGFFDHLLRHDESYAEKWLYVRDNPVREHLVAKWDDWPYHGEIVVIDRV